MKAAIILATIASAILVSAHGHITQIDIAKPGSNDKTTYKGNQPNGKAEGSDQVTWNYKDNGPVRANEADKPAIACSHDANARGIKNFAKAKVGDEITFHWSKWSRSHRGPTMTYIAPIPNGQDVEKLDPSTLTWYKIHHKGLLKPNKNKDNTYWASDEMIDAGFKIKVGPIPQVPSGKYVLRHELLALHLGHMDTKGGAQFYPVCMNFEIEGSPAGGQISGQGVKITEIYKEKEVNINIQNGIEKYDIPGPAPIGGAPKRIRGINWRAELANHKRDDAHGQGEHVHVEDELVVDKRAVKMQSIEDEDEDDIPDEGSYPEEDEDDTPDEGNYPVEEDEENDQDDE